MSAGYTLTTAAVTAAASTGLFASFKAGASAPCEILRIAVTNPAATLLNLQIGRPNTVSASPLTTVQAGPMDPGNTRAAAARLELTWTTPPTSPTSLGMIDTMTSAASIGTGYIWVWPDNMPLVIPAGGGLSFINFGVGTGPAFNLTILYKE